MDRVGQYCWESKDSWYNPGLRNATFLVIDTTNRGTPCRLLEDFAYRAQGS